MNLILRIFTNGFNGTWPALEYAAWLAKNMNTHLTLTGVVEDNDADHPVEEFFSRAVSLFQEKNVNYSLELENGTVEEILAKQVEFQESSNRHTSGGASVTRNEDYPVIDRILIIGPFGRPQVKRMLVGNSFRKIMGVVSVPILYIPSEVVRLPIQRVLICIGGLGNLLTTQDLGLKIARMNHAKVKLLTVVPLIDLDYPEARKIRENWQNLADTDTIQGRTLREGLRKAQEAGLDVAIKVRHGNIVEQVLAEIKEGDYDLVCMGSQYSSLGLRQFYSPNVTADVAEACQCPILTVRHSP